MPDHLTRSQRNEFRSDDGYILLPLSVDDVASLPADFCGNSDLNEFFKEDCLAYAAELFSKNYKMVHDSVPDKIVGLVSLSNDALRLKTSSQKRREIPNLKRYMDSFPAVKIGRLGIRKELQGEGAGSFLIGVLKRFFLTGNRTGCRFITVDAYNEDSVINFYSRNGFKVIDSAERESKSSTVSM